MEGWPSGADPRQEPAPAPLAAGRLPLLRECLAELPVQLREGDRGPGGGGAAVAHPRPQDLPGAAAGRARLAASEAQLALFEKAKSLLWDAEGSLELVS